MKLNRLTYGAVSHKSPPQRPQLQNARAAETTTPSDIAQLSSSARGNPPTRPWLKKLGLGIAMFAAVAGAFSPALQAADMSLRDQNFEVVQTLAYNKDEKAPCGESVELLREYSQTDFGAPMFAEIAKDAKQAVADGMLSPEGEVTVEGEFEGYQPFRISCGQGAQGGPNGIVLPAEYPEHFKHSGQEIHPLAIVHHEMGHTKYGMPAQPSDIVTDHQGSRYSVDHELEIVKRFENPVREQYGYKARTSYTNHLGESAHLDGHPHKH